MNQDDYHILMIELVNVKLSNALSEATKKDRDDLWADCVEQAIAQIKAQSEHTNKGTVKDLKNNFRKMIKDIDVDWKRIQ